MTVPPLRHGIVGGHVTLWNAGLLLYNLVLARFDCSAAAVLAYDYNISVIARRGEFVLPELHYDSGDVDVLQEWSPAGLSEGFDGRIEELNWWLPAP